MSVFPFDHPALGAYLGDPEVAGLLSWEAELAGMIRFEVELARAAAQHGLLTHEAAQAIGRASAGFRPDLDALARATARDGVLVPELVRQLRAAVGEPYGREVHRGATSQDLIDTTLLVRLQRVADVIDGRLGRIAERLESLARDWGARQLFGRTRMRRARPISWAHKIASWREPLLRHRARLVELRRRVFILQLGGAVGDRAELGPLGGRIADTLAEALGLGRSARATHVERDGLVELAGWLGAVAGSLGKIGQDVTILAQDEVGELLVEGGGTSSAMPGKVNPTLGEALVALGRFAGIQAGGMLQALIHENERSGAAWTLEWLLLPGLCLAAGASTRLAERLLTQLRLPENGVTPTG